MANLKEELARYNAINKYGDLLREQAAPPPPPPAPPAAGAGADPMDMPPAGGAGAPPPADPAAAGAPPAGAPPTDAPPADLAGEGEKPVDPALDDTTEEMDITDLVNMTKSIKKELESSKGQDNGSTQKMDDIFSKLGELEQKLGDMNNVIAKIDALGVKIDEVKPKSAVEKLEMRSLDSYPFNKKPDEFFADKLPEMKATGKNEYVLTKGDVENYGRNEIMKSFNSNMPENT